MELKELIDKQLIDVGFSVQEMTEVYSTNDDGTFVKSDGFFKNEHVAESYTEGQSGGTFYSKTRKKIVLTDGKTAFVINELEVVLLDDEKATLEARERALTKLSSAEKKLLGL